MEYLRHAEYYDMQSTFDELYARSQAGEIFENLMDVILSRENILLAYRNIKGTLHIVVFSKAEILHAFAFCFLLIWHQASLSFMASDFFLSYSQS